AHFSQITSARGAEMIAEAQARGLPVTADVAMYQLLLTFLGVFGVHRMYQGKWITGILYLFTGAFFLLGVL
ncbi:NINE protein, partial [Pseudomonas otitidis]